ncbi:MAG TPA: hypothetical protein GX401_03495 [Clostridiales bacterium]|nr:hypothetical protein [Clostridiales bacterium]
MRCYGNQKGGLLAFGIGLLCGCLFPDRFVLVIAAVVIIILALAICKC